MWLVTWQRLAQPPPTSPGPSPGRRIVPPAKGRRNLLPSQGRTARWRATRSCRAVLRPGGPPQHLALPPQRLLPCRPSPPPRRLLPPPRRLLPPPQRLLPPPQSPPPPGLRPASAEERGSAVG